MTPAVAMALEGIRQAMKGRDRILAAIDGPCASGKTTLAAELSAQLDCPVVHADHFFLRPEQRTPARLAEPGGNLDRERLASEVLLFLRAGKDAQYRPFLCSQQCLGDTVTIPSAPVVLVEGSYCCHPELAELYDLRLFLRVDPEKQLQRLAHRESPESLERFRTVWIPLENRYFAVCGTEHKAHIVL